MKKKRFPQVLAADAVNNGWQRLDALLCLQSCVFLSVWTAVRWDGCCLLTNLECWSGRIWRWATWIRKSMSECPCCTPRVTTPESLTLTRQVSLAMQGTPCCATKCDKAWQALMMADFTISFHHAAHISQESPYFPHELCHWPGLRMREQPKLSTEPSPKRAFSIWLKIKVEIKLAIFTLNSICFRHCCYTRFSQNIQQLLIEVMNWIQRQTNTRSAHAWPNLLG